MELEPSSNNISSGLAFEDEMLELYEAFYPNNTSLHQGPITTLDSVTPLLNPPPTESSSHVSSQQLAVLQSLQAQHQFQARQQHYYYWQNQQQQQPIPRKSCGIRKKKKTEELKTVYKVPAENILTIDKWAWRKYGQKPIKGSPFPRNYYRCSSSKGCTARKQVERSITESEVYVVTYTGDHLHPWPLHRNALAGISRSDHKSCAYRHDLTNICHVAISESPLPPVTLQEVEEEEGFLIPNRKYADEDMLREMEELVKWKTTTTTTTKGSSSASRTELQLDAMSFY